MTRLAHLLEARGVEEVMTRRSIVLELEPGAFVRDAEFVLGGAGLVE